MREIYNAKGIDHMCFITDSLAVSAIEPGSDVDPGIIDPRTIIETVFANSRIAVHWPVRSLRWIVLCARRYSKPVSRWKPLAA